MEEKKLNELNDNLESVKENAKKKVKEKKKKIKDEKKELHSEFTKKGLMKNLLLVSLVPLLAMAIILTVVSSYKISDVMKNDTFSELKAVAIMAEKMYDEIDDGEYKYNNNEFVKGDYKITNSNAMIDTIKKKTGDNITVYYGKSIILTTIFDKDKNRVTQSEAEKKVVENVINKGKEYKCNEKIAGTEFSSYYIPLKDTSGKVIGMLSTSKETKNITSTILKSVILVAICMLVILSISLCSITTFTSKIIKKIKGVSGYLGNIRNGDLTTSINQKSLNDKTEIGDMAESALKLNFALSDMVDNIKNTVEKLSVASDKMKETAEITNRTTEDVNKAIEEIATGTVSQAEETQNATDNVIKMGEAIEEISLAVEKLSENAIVINKNGEEADKMITNLSKANIKTMDAVDKIYEHTELTNQAVIKISQAANIITAIAEETNLLALNASIEAARAGENGKGFAVVASEIQSLAEQSNVSADEIMKEIDNLMNESELSVKIMQDVKNNIDMQSDKLAETKNNFDVVTVGIKNSANSISIIEQLMNGLNENRKSIIDIIQSLSAISEENAAASEETSASTIQLSEVINDLANDANGLKILADKLEGDVSVFKTK